MTTTRTTTSVSTMTITGSGGISTAANKITFNFNKAIKDGVFTVNDIGIVNGTINPDSFTKVSATQYTIMVTPSLGGKHSHLANIPTVNILIKGVCVIKHPRHISHIANIPTTNVLIKGICMITVLKTQAMTPLPTLRQEIQRQILTQILLTLVTC
jgi:hypothetical protein